MNLPFLNKNSVAAPAQSARTRRGSKYFQLGCATLALAAIALAATIHQSFDRDLTGLETTLFNCIIFVLSVVGSVLVSGYFSEQQARQEYEQLARPSLRRIASLEKAVEIVASSVRERSERSDASEDQKIWLDGLDTNLKLVIHQIRDALDDWRELLPDDYEDQLRKVSDELNKLLSDLNEHQATIRSLQTELAEQVKAHNAGDRAAKAKIENLEKEIQRQKQASTASLNSYSFDRPGLKPTFSTPEASMIGYKLAKYEPAKIFSVDDFKPENDDPK